MHFFLYKSILAWLSFSSCVSYISMFFCFFFKLAFSFISSNFSVFCCCFESLWNFLSCCFLCRRFSESSDKGWFRSLFVHKVDARKDAHSNLLSKKETSNLYKIQCRHNIFCFVTNDGLSSSRGPNASDHVRVALCYNEMYFTLSLNSLPSICFCRNQLNKSLNSVKSRLASL